VPARIVAVDDLPRTRSNKLAELAVADVIHGREVRNREALANPESLDAFRDLPALSR
jgi:acetoacetyl-CoA synthetase